MESKIETNPSTGSGPRTNARDFFLHLGAIVALYAVTISLVNLLFTIINKVYPGIQSMYYYYGIEGPYNISLPVATLLIVFPILILLSWLLNKSYAVDASRKETWIRRWLVYITLFVAGIIFVGDLVTVLYKFLNGEDLTAAFFLKALTVLVATGLVFGYYLQEIRGRISGKARKVWAIASAVVVLVAIILGFSIIGSPRSQRLLRYDDQKLSDLQNMQWRVMDYWQRKGILPANIAELNDPLSGYQLPRDPQGDSTYVYNKTGDKSFELCAVFNKEMMYPVYANSMASSPTIRSSYDHWSHGVGRQCFDRTIDETLYPVTKPIK